MNARVSSSNTPIAQPPRSNPPLRSSSDAAPFPCITPSTVTCVMVVSFIASSPSRVVVSLARTAPRRRPHRSERVTLAGGRGIEENGHARRPPRQKEPLSGAEQRAERRRVIVPAAAMQIRLADQLSRRQPRQAHAFARKVSLVGIAQSGGGSGKAEPAPTAGVDERQEALEAQHALERLRRKTDSRLDAPTQLALGHEQRGGLWG